MVEKSGAKLVSEMAGTTKIFGRDDKLAVVFSGKRASSKKGLVVLPDISETEVTPKQSALMRGFVDQESGYVKHSDLGEIDRLSEVNPLKAAVLKGIEDVRITQKRQQEYMGSRRNLSELLNSTAKSFKKNFKADEDADWKESLPFAISLLGRDLPGIDADLDGIREKLPEETVKKFDDFRSKIQTSSSFEESLEIASELIDTPDEESESEDSKGEGDNDDAESERGKEAYEKMTKMNSEEINKLELSTADNYGKEIYDIDEFIYASDAYGITPHEKIKCEDAIGAINNFKRISSSDYQTAVTGKISSVVMVAKKKLEYLLFSKIDRNWLSAQPEGRLDNKRVASVPTGNRLVFKTRAPRKEVDTAVMVLVDLSGSMHGRKVEVAQQCALVFSECLNKCGVNFSICGFNDPHEGYYFKNVDDVHPYHRAELGASKCEDMCRSRGGENSIRSNMSYDYSLGKTRRYHAGHLYVYKSFQDKYIQVRKSILAMEHHCGGNNYDCSALHHSYHMLKKQQERKKVMFVLSDGQPSSWSEAYHPTEEKIKEIEADKSVILMGIGILHNTAEMYKNHTVVKSVDDLGNRCFETLAAQLS